MSVAVEMDQVLRQCRKCGETKPLDQFPKAGHALSDGGVGVWYRGDCRACRSAYYARRFAERQAAAQRAKLEKRKALAKVIRLVAPKPPEPVPPEPRWEVPVCVCGAERLAHAGKGMRGPCVTTGCPGWHERGV